MYETTQELTCYIEKVDANNYAARIVKQNGETVVSFNASNFAFIIRWALFAVHEVFLLSDEIDGDQAMIRVTEVFN